MLVKRFMSRNTVVIGPGADIAAAAALLKAHSIRHLPVVEEGRLVGLITEGALREAAFPAMIAELTVRDLMIGQPLTIGGDTPLEEAARKVYVNKVGCLPVVDRSQRLEGIITVVDMLGALIELMGLLSENSRLDVSLPDDQGAFEHVCRIIQKNGGRITNITLTRVFEDKPVHLFRLEKIDLDPIIDEIERSGYKVLSRLN